MTAMVASQGRRVRELPGQQSLIRPLRFEVRAPDGALLDSFTEEDLVAFCFDARRTLSEAMCWAYVAWCDWRRRK